MFHCKYIFVDMVKRILELIFSYIPQNKDLSLHNIMLFVWSVKSIDACHDNNFLTILLWSHVNM